MPVGCGQCLPCRISRRRMWTARQYLEALCHDENAFVTLTYDDEHLPDGGTLVPKHVQDWLKTLRSGIGDTKIRYFLAGEYGEHSLRPHYHLSVFGAGLWLSEYVEKYWKFGFVQVAEFNEYTAQYVCGYVTKKLSNDEDGRLDGRANEFARMSNRPGLGAPAMEVIARQLHTINGLEEIERSGDVPFYLKVGKKRLPLGRYLRDKLRDEVGMPESWRSRVRQRWIDEAQEKVLPLLSVAIDEGKVASVKSVTVEVNLGKIQSVEARSKLRKRGSL